MESLFSSSIGRSKKYYNVPTHKDNFVSKGKNAFKKGKFLGGRLFSLVADFTPSCPEKSAMSWKHLSQTHTLLAPAGCA
jgi:hypothetical protein